MVETEQECREKALALRERAAAILYPEARRVVIALAESYERLADWLNRSRARAADSLGSNAVPT